VREYQSDSEIGGFSASSRHGLSANKTTIGGDDRRITIEASKKCRLPSRVLNRVRKTMGVIELIEKLLLPPLNHVQHIDT